MNALESEFGLKLLYAKLRKNVVLMKMTISESKIKPTQTTLTISSAPKLDRNAYLDLFNPFRIQLICDRLIRFFILSSRFYEVKCLTHVYISTRFP